MFYNAPMTSLRLTPWFSALKALQYLLSGRLHFPKEQVGAGFGDERGQRFRVFRYAVVNPGPAHAGKPQAVFIPHFHVAGMSVRVNMLFSLLPIPFYIGLPGFRSKRWMVDDATGDFAGYYEWETVANAENYAHSFAAKFMTARSVPGSVWFKVYPVETAPAPPAHVSAEKE
jgi:hypothetical protein